MPRWRNWQTRTFEGRMGNRTGSSPVLGTNFKINEQLKLLFFILLSWHSYFISGIFY